MKLFKQKGFTLIELLIVVAIIGVLATLLMANFVGVRQRARDAQRKADLKQMQSALEMFRSDQNSYPTSAQWPTCGNPLSVGSVVYMATVPCDPLSGWVYTYVPSGSGYTIYACLENGGDAQKDSTTNPTYCSGKAASYHVDNP